MLYTRGEWAEVGRVVVMDGCVVYKWGEWAEEEREGKRKRKRVKNYIDKLNQREEGISNTYPPSLVPSS